MSTFAATETRKKKRNLTMAINVNIRKDEDQEKLMRTIQGCIKKAGRYGTVQVFLNDQIVSQNIAPTNRSSPNVNHVKKEDSSPTFDNLLD